MVLPELRVVDGTRKDPLFIIGADMMAPDHPGSWDFLHVGFHPVDRRGVMTFVDACGNECSVDLASWPQRASRWVHPPENKVEALRSGLKSKKKLKWADEKEAVEKKREVSSGQQLIALLKRRGRCV